MNIRRKLALIMLILSWALCLSAFEALSAPLAPASQSETP